jgi:hypothetical protein
MIWRMLPERAQVSTEEAAAIAIAIARFRRDMAPAPAVSAAPPERSAWTRAARREATGQADDASWSR